MSKKVEISEWMDFHMNVAVMNISLDNYEPPYKPPSPNQPSPPSHSPLD